jgi:hypothetical protein
MTRIYPPLTALLLLVVCGVVHGLWTDRWARGEEPAAAADRLDRLPLVLGDWEGQVLTVDTRHLGSISGCLYRHYVNRRSGADVSVFLVCGRPGPVAIHTPDVCYGASGYVVGSRSTYSLPSGSLPPGQFYTAQFRKTKATEQMNLRVFWSWYAAGNWVVAENPRFAFAHHPVLYKLYLVHQTAPGSESFADDPCIDLMSQLLPEMQRTVLSGP